MHPSENCVDGGDTQVNDENVTNDEEPYHDELVEVASSEPSIKS